MEVELLGKMNYFLINNGFHFNFIKKYLKNELNESILLVNLHNIDIKLIKHYKSVIFSSPIHTYYDVFKIRSFKKILYDITSSIHLNPQTDVLYVSSEQDILNLKIINFFYNKNVNIILLEDGTFTPLYLTIIKNNYTFNFFHLFLLNTFFFYFLIFFIKLKNVKMNFQYNIPVYRIKDNIYSKALVTSNYDLCRKIEKIELIGIKKDNPQNHTYSNIAIFANSPHNIEIGNIYFKILKVAINNFAKEYNCNTIIFCFHPRDTESDKKEIKKQFTNVNMVQFENFLSTEEIVKATNPKYLVSFMSTSLIEFKEYTEKVIFLIKKYPDVIFPLISDRMIKYLNSIQN
jgi:hypothetical protein